MSQWACIESETVRNLVNSIPTRCIEVIELRGQQDPLLNKCSLSLVFNLDYCMDKDGLFFGHVHFSTFVWENSYELLNRVHYTSVLLNTLTVTGLHIEGYSLPCVLDAWDVIPPKEI